MSSNFVARVTVCTDLGTHENKVCHFFHCFPIFCHELMRLDAMILVFSMLSFKPPFSFSSFHPHQEALYSSLLSAIRVVSSAYLRLFIFLPAILTPAYNSSSLAFFTMCSEYRLNKQGDSRQLCGTSFSILNQSVVPYSVLTVAS